jgi:vitamin B12/bleomycin/antimicrobial peptide transport system ATP-binding/permease protein
LAFARLLLQRPDIIVLDEATAALDQRSQKRMMEMLLQEFEDATIVSIGHRPELTAFHHRKIVLGRGGRAEARIVSDACAGHGAGRMEQLRNRTGRDRRTGATPEIELFGLQPA